MVANTATKLELFLQSPGATWNRERWEELPADGNRYEVISGVLYMSTAPSPLHQWISRLIEGQCYTQLDNRGMGITFHAPVGLFMPGCDPVQPDVMVLAPADRHLIFERHIETIPLLIVEILSQSNTAHDLVTKRQAYAHAGVPEYWIVRPQARDVLVHSQPEPAIGQYLQVTHVPPDGELSSPTLPFRVPVAAFFPVP